MFAIYDGKFLPAQDRSKCSSWHQNQISCWRGVEG